jgi:DNA-binding transcriptional ArsR family regulator
MLADQLSLTFAALSDPTRRQIVERLSQGEATVTELGEPLSISMPAVSRHLKVLEKAGLIARGRDAQWRPSRLRSEPLSEAMDWIGSRKQQWEQGIERLDAHLRTKGEENGHRHGS